MFHDNPFGAAVFIGGMKGVVEEFRLLRDLQPEAVLIPITSTGGATLDIANEIGEISGDLELDFDYVSLLHRHLDISPAEKRYASPSEQPTKLEDRLFKPGHAKNERSRPSS